MTTYFIIPARRDSKGVPHKNRELVPNTIQTIPKECHHQIILTTNDKKIIENIKETQIKIRERPEHLATDTTPMKDVIVDIVESFALKPSDTVVVLYPTYPDRTFNDILSALHFYKKYSLDSMLCKKNIKTHPYLCMVSTDNLFAKPLIEHQLYRRQDYPDCFEICHFVTILRVGALERLNNQLMYDKTGFYKIEDKLNVDYLKDYEKFKMGQKNE